MRTSCKSGGFAGLLMKLSKLMEMQIINFPVVIEVILLEREKRAKTWDSRQKLGPHS